MDLTKFEPATASIEGVKMELYHPVTEVSFEPPIYITVIGIDSDVYRAAQRELTNKRLKKAQARNRFRFQATAEELEQDSIDLLAKSVLGWENIEWEGKTLPFSYDNAKKIVTVPWIREQIDTFVGDRANFLKT